MSMDDRELLYWNAFNNIPGFGPQRFKKLNSFFDSLENAWKANRLNLVTSGVGEKQADFFIAERDKISPEKLFEELEKEDIQMIIYLNQKYPPQLKEIPSAPPVLYLKGNQELLSCKSVAVVGSRKFTSYGERVVQSLCRELAQAGLVIVSGLAIGIDALSHRAVLEAQGKTTAVLGSGLDKNSVYPRVNFNLAQEIAEADGVLVSEYPPRTPSLKQNFPARNRIMAGLALGTIVIEADGDSGSLITANYSLEFNREVFAVPGSIFSPQSIGTNQLIKNGAKLVGSAADVLEELNIQTKFTETSREQKIFNPNTEEEKTIWKILSTDPQHIDTIVKLSKLNAATVSSLLASLEIQGVVKNIGGQNYIKL